MRIVNVRNLRLNRMTTVNVQNLRWNRMTTVNVQNLRWNRLTTVNVQNLRCNRMKTLDDQNLGLEQNGNGGPSNKTTSVALSPQANYTHWATATCRRNLVPNFVDKGASRGQRGGSPTVVNLSFLDRSRYFFFQVAPHLSSQGLSGPRSRPTATHKIW
jgi:hypothetical protein